MTSGLMVGWFSLVGVSALSRDPCSQFKGLSSGGVALALQASALLRLGVDNLGVVRHVSRLLDGVRHPCPAELLKDGDLVLLIGRILDRRRRGHSSCYRG